MRYVLEMPRTEHELLEEVARRENVSPRALLVWLIQKELRARAERLDEPRPDSPDAAH